MLNTINLATGLKLEYVCEEYYRFLLLNTVQYRLKDEEGNLYFFVVSFDKTQDFWLDREDRLRGCKEDNTGFIWSGKVSDLRCCLYRYPKFEEASSKNVKFKTVKKESVSLTEEIIKKIEKDFLDSYPEKYREKIKSFTEFKRMRSILLSSDSINVSDESGVFSKEQLSIENGELTVTVCDFFHRSFQPAGYNEYVCNKVLNNNASVENKSYNKIKYLLEKKITALIEKERKPQVKCFEWKSEEEHKEPYSLNNYYNIYPSNDNYYLTIKTDYDEIFLPLSIKGDRAVFGTWMNKIGRECLLAAVEFTFGKFGKVKTIEYNNVLYDTLLDHGWKHNDFYLPLPTTVEELKSRVSSKSRYNLKRERRIIEEAFGGLALIDVPFDKVEQKYIDKFYEFKNATHGISVEKYDIRSRNLTDVYLLVAGKDDIKGVAVSCEQSDIVFLENHTFDSSMRQYSFGQVLYDMYLDEMVGKGKKGVALAGGELEYKKRYGTYCAIARSGKIKRKTNFWSYLAKKFGFDPRDRIFRLIANKLNTK